MKAPSNELTDMKARIDENQFKDFNIVQYERPITTQIEYFQRQGIVRLFFSLVHLSSSWDIYVVMKGDDDPNLYLKASI
jgi:hypothetical protein